MFIYEFYNNMKSRTRRRKRVNYYRQVCMTTIEIKTITGKIIIRAVKDYSPFSFRVTYFFNNRRQKNVCRYINQNRWLHNISIGYPLCDFERTQSRWPPLRSIDRKWTRGTETTGRNWCSTFFSVPIQLPAIYVARTFSSVITSILEESGADGKTRGAKNRTVSLDRSGGEYLLRFLMRSICRERLDNCTREPSLPRVIKRSSLVRFFIYLYLSLLQNQRQYSFR